MGIKYLVDEPSAIPIIAKWLKSEWGYLQPDSTEEDLIQRLESRASKESIPIHLVAKKDGEFVAFAALKYGEMKQYPEKEYWLGSLYVLPKFRGAGVASKMVREIEKIARIFSLPIIYLQTERLGGGLYTRLGWKPIDIVKDRGDKVLVMQRHLNEWC